MKRQPLLPTLGLLTAVALCGPRAHGQTNPPHASAATPAAASAAVSPSDPDFEKKRARAVKNLKSMEVYDKNRNGKIDADERPKLSEDSKKVIQNRFEKPGPDQETYRRQIDSNGDGTLDDQERDAAAQKYAKDLEDTWNRILLAFPDLAP
jgi:hypothetical protein